MKNYLLLSILCLAGILMSCTQKHTRYRIGVSQCSDDEWRHKMNNEIVREALFYDGVEVEISEVETEQSLYDKFRKKQKEHTWNLMKDSVRY